MQNLSPIPFPIHPQLTTPFSPYSNNGQWNPSPTTYYQSWTTWTSMLVYGTATVTITSTVPCPTPVWVTTTQLVETTPVCNECQPVSTIYDTWPTTTYWYGYSTPTTTTYIPEVTTAQQSYTAITSGTIVSVFATSTTAAAGQATTNGVVAVISAGAGGREEAGLLKPRLAVAGAAVLALVAM